jgi:hypothetical protein
MIRHHAQGCNVDCYKPHTPELSGNNIAWTEGTIGTIHLVLLARWGRLWVIANGGEATSVRELQGEAYKP